LREILANSRKSQHRFRPQFRYKLNHLLPPLLQTRKANAKKQDKKAECINVIACHDYSYKIERRRSEAILKLLAKLKIRKSSKSQAQLNSCKSVTSK